MKTAESQPVTFGFILPPDGEVIDLSNVPIIETAHHDFCKAYIEEHENPLIYKHFKPIWLECRENDFYSDYCMMVLGWCRVGNVFPEKTIYLSFGFDWHVKVIDEYEKLGYTFVPISDVQLFEGYERIPTKNHLIAYKC